MSKIACHTNRIHLKYLDKQDFANGIDPDQAPQNAGSDKSRHSLPLIKQILEHVIVYKNDHFTENHMKKFSSIQKLGKFIYTHTFLMHELSFLYVDRYLSTLHQSVMY